MIQEPPPLPFPSLTKLKAPAKEILDAQRNPTSPDMEFKFFQPTSSSETDKKKQRPNKKACDVCKKKKVKCDNNVVPNEICTRATCPCIYHVAIVNTDDDNISNDKKDTQFDSNNRLTSALPPPLPSSSSSLSSLSSSSSNNNKNDIVNNIPSATVFRKPGLLYSGHYAGETAFCGYLQPENQPPVITEEDQFPTFDPTPIQAPYITDDDQLYLINTYYENLNPFFPILNKDELILQLQFVMNKRPTYLSPLFFYAVFARAAHVETSRNFTQYNQQSFKDLGDNCVTYVSALVNCYRDRPRISTVLALVIMSNHLEQTKLPEKLTRSWLWAGEAFRIALDLGVHRSLISEENDHVGQLCIRTFWLAYITDCTISMTYGRPSATEEKVVDVTSPKRLLTDDDCTAEWLDGLNSLISLSKIAVRVIKFNYCPPPPFKIQGPVKRHNAFLASVDSWLTDIMHPNSVEPDSPISSTANVIIKETNIAKRISFQKKMFLYTNLILLHRPYVNDSAPTRNSARPSYDICTYAAIIITNAASKLDQNELIYHSNSPMIAYALVMALRVHIMNAINNSSVDKFNAEKNFTTSINTLDKLPQSQNRSSLLYEALADLKDQYDNRFILAQEEEIRIRQQAQKQQSEQQLVITPNQANFNPGSKEKRKERPCSISGSSETSKSNCAPTTNNLSMKYYQPPGETTIAEKKKKKAKSTVQQPTFVDSQQKKKHKQKQIQQSHQHVFSTNTTTAGGNSQQQQQNDLPLTPTTTFPPQQKQSQQVVDQTQLQTPQPLQEQQVQEPHSMQLRCTNQQLNQQSYYLQRQQQTFASNSDSGTNLAADNSSSILQQQSYSHIDYSMLQQQQFLITTPSEPQLYHPPQQQQFTLSDEDFLNLGFFGVAENNTLNIPNDDMLYDAFMKSYSTTTMNDSSSISQDNTRVWCVSNENNRGVSITPAAGYSSPPPAFSSVNNGSGSPLTTSYPSSSY